MSDRDAPDSNADDFAWQRLRTALGAAGMGTWHVDLRTGVLTYDENLNGILGLEPLQTSGALHDPAFSRVHPDDQARVRDAIDSAVATRADYSLEFRIVRPDGHVRWLRDRGRIVIDDAGVPLSATGAVMDITEQRRLEDHDRMLAAATQVLATSVDYEETLAALPNALVPRFADWASVHLADGEGLQRIAAAETRRSRPRRAAGHRLYRLGHPGSRSAVAAAAAARRRDTIGVMAYVMRTRTSTARRSPSRRNWRIVSRCRSIARGCSAICSGRTGSRTSSSPRSRTSCARRSTPCSAGRACCGAAPAADRTRARPRDDRAQRRGTDAAGRGAAGSLGDGRRARLNLTRVDVRELVGGAVETVRPAADGRRCASASTCATGRQRSPAIPRGCSRCSGTCSPTP